MPFTYHIFCNKSNVMMRIIMKIFLLYSQKIPKLDKKKNVKIVDMVHYKSSLKRVIYLDN